MEGRRNSGAYVSHINNKKFHHLGYGYIHAAVDDHSRLAYVEVLEDEKSTTASEFA